MIKTLKIVPINFSRDKKNINMINKFIFTLVFSAVLLNFVNLNAQTKKVSNNEKVFELGILRNSFINVNINDASVAISTWANELRRQLKIHTKFKLVIFNNTEDMVKYNTKKKLGMVILNSIDYLKLHNKMSLYPIITTGNNKNIYSKLYIITRKINSDNISELKGKKIGFYLGRNNPIPKYWISVMLYKNKQGSIKKFFSQITEYQKESQLILSVFFGQIDAGVVTQTAFETMNELNPQIGKKLRIFKVSPGYLFDISSLTSGSIHYSYSSRIEKSAININKYPAGKELMTLMKTDQVFAFKSKYLKSTEELFNEYNAIKK